VSAVAARPCLGRPLGRLPARELRGKGRGAPGCCEAPARGREGRREAAAGAVRPKALSPALRQSSR